LNFKQPSLDERNRIHAKHTRDYFYTVRKQKNTPDIEIRNRVKQKMTQKSSLQNKKL